MPEENENIEREQEEQNTTAKEQQQEDGSEPQKSESPTIDKATERKVIFSLCYLWGILFFLPLVLYKGDANAHRHLSLIHIRLCRRYAVCRSRWSPYH